MVKRWVLLVAALVMTVSAHAAAQGDVLSRARQAARTGHRAEALSMLEAHLTTAPADVDARLLYGLVLSWDGRYDEARAVLRQVLAQAPSYTDARVALMNVEHWDGRATEARELADQILSTHPGNAAARRVREQLDAASRPWWINTAYSLDTFSDDKDPWQEAGLSVMRHTLVGPAIVRATYANRFGHGDQLLEGEFYPTFRPGTYAYVAAGIAPEHELYPSYRLAGELYQSLGRGFEISGGARYLAFEPATSIYLGTLTKYAGHWMLTGKVSYIPAGEDPHTTSYTGRLRRYVGGEGTSYFGLIFSHGFSREEIRSESDLATLDSNAIAGEWDVVITDRLRVFGSASTSRQEQASGDGVWQTTIVNGLWIRF